MSVEEDLSLEAKAREWLDMAQTKWRLQTMQHRSRFNPKTGEYRQLPTRVRRFLNGTPVSMKSRVLSILKESAPYSCPVFDLETGDAKYVPTSTFIRKDGPELVSGGADATYTIVQDLKLLDEAGDVFGIRDESSCAQVGETEWHWDEPDVMDCPDGSQGVSYQVANVSRDRETDLFSYAIRKVQALTVHVPPVTVACTERSRVTVESWDNVYGEPGAFRWDPVRGGHAALAVPGACDRSGGTLVRVSVNRNADCTYRVDVERTEAVSGVGMYYTQRDQYKTEAGERTLNAFEPLPKQGVEYDNGLVTRYQSERNEDGTWTNEVGTTLERPVSASTVEERVTTRGTTRTRIDTNMPDPASGISTEFGSWKSVKTPGGLFTNEYVEHVRRVADGLGLLCTDTAFMKTHETQGSADSVPSSGHVPPAGGGLVTTWNYDTDADGLVTKRIRTDQEHTVENAVRRKVWGWLGDTSGYVHRSVSPETASGLLASGAAGTSVEARMTNGGLFDVEVQTFLRIAGLRLGFECQKTVYQHVHETAESASEIGAEAQAAGDGKTYRRSYSLDTSTGAITKRETETTELEVPESRRSVRVTARGKTVRTVKSNAQSKPADALTPGQTSEFEVTPGGRFNVTLEETTPREGALEAGCQKDAFEETDSAAATSSVKGADHVQGGTGGVYREAVSRLGDDGLWENRTVDHKETPDVDDGVDVVVTARGKRKTTRTRSATTLPAEPTTQDVGKSLRTSRTRGGRYNFELTETTANPAALGEDCSKDVFEHVDGTTKTSATKPDDHVDGGSGGKYSERTSRLGDDGLWETREVEHVEEQDVDDGVDVVVTARGKRKTTRTRSATTLPAEPTTQDVGKSLRTSRTRGGRYNFELTETTANPAALGEDCSKDLFSHVHTTTATNTNKADNDVPDAADGSGEYLDRRQRLGDDGLWEITNVKHTEKSVSSQRTEVRVTRAGLVKRTTDVQVDETGQDPTAVIADIGKERIVEKTRGGKRNITIVEVTPIKDTTRESCSQDAFLHTHVKTKGVDSNSLDGVDVPEAGDGEYVEKDLVLNDAGVWEERETKHTEIAQQAKTVHYKDAFGERVVKLFANGADKFDDMDFDEGALIKSVEQEMTRGKKYSARITEETPTPVDSGWRHFDKATNFGSIVNYDFIVFRNASMTQVNSWIMHIMHINYAGGSGSITNSPSISISPNRFKLWDGAIAITTRIEPKAVAAGGNAHEDNWMKDNIEIMSVNFVPLSQTKLLKIVTTETHKRGGGVGRDVMEAVLAAGPMIKGSQFSYHPGGQAFSYDIITRILTKAVVIDMPQAATTVWDGTAL